MGLFGRKPKDDPAEATEEAASAAPEQQDPAAWALPADAGVAAGDTVEQDSVPATPEDAGPGPAPESPTPYPAPAAAAVAPATAAGGHLGAAAGSPAAGSDPAAPDPAASETPYGSSATPPGSSSDAPYESSGTPQGSSAGGLSAVLDNPTFQQRPELAIAGAFAGAFVVARILRRIAE